MTIKSSLALGLGTVMFSFSVLPQDADALRSGVARCAAQSGELARLACYDELAKSAGLTASTAVNTTPDGNWVVREEKNPLDDSTTVMLINRASEGQSSFGRPIALVMTCQSNRTSVYINWNDYLGSEASVMSRVGSEQAKRQRWPLSTDNEATFYPADNVAFIKELMNVDTFVAQVTPYNESPVTAVWNIGGLSSAIDPLRRTCNW